jgi:hypothetical protein
MTDKRNDKYFRKIVSEYYQTKVMIITSITRVFLNLPHRKRSLSGWLLRNLKFPKQL